MTYNLQLETSCVMCLVSCVLYAIIYSMTPRHLSLIALLLLASIALPGYSATSEDWYPYTISSNLSPTSPLNIGKLVLDAPAGKHGFVKVKDGHFYFEDGTRAKFWGTNLCFNACFPTHKQAEMLAERIAYFGFNAVRLHHMDFYFEPKGIFEDTAPAYKDPQMKKTGILSKAQLDKLDYLIYQLKIRGIYVDMNLLVARHFTEADGIKDAGKLGMAAKPYSMFDRKLIILQKQYAKDLLTHLNPYTKLKYCDDPVVGLVEIINETSLNKFNPSKAPKYYQEQLGISGVFAPEILEKKYFDEMTHFLKIDVKVKCPITGSQFANVSAQTSCDFIDKHAYWDHPKFPRKPWDNNDFIIKNNSILTDENLGIVGRLLKSQPKDKPYTVTEWNHCYPNQYAYETPIVLATEAQKYNWDGLFQFAFSHGWKEEPAFDNINNYFNTIANPQKLILTSLGGLIFLKGENTETNFKEGIFTVTSPSLNAVVGFIKDKPLALGPFTITADQNGAVALLKNAEKYTLFAVSEVKNSGSGWNAEGKFNWGNAPVLLKQINVTVQRNGKTVPIDLSKSPYLEIKL